MCGKMHSGLCHRITGTCFQCGQTGDLRRDYPQVPRGQGRGLVQSIALSSSPLANKSRGDAVRSAGRGSRGRGAGGRGSGSVGRGQPRVYALTRQDAQASNAVVADILSICSFDAHALIDPGSTHSYVSIYFASQFGGPPEPLDQPFWVGTPMGESLLVTFVHRSCLVTINGKDFMVDLIVLDLMDFDVILGMDWLASYHVTIDCHHKIARFAISGEAPFEFRGNVSTSPSKLISFLRAMHLLKRGVWDIWLWCEMFLLKPPRLHSFR